MKGRVNEISRNRKYGHQRALASMVYKFFHKKTGSGISVNEQLANELHKPVIKKFKGRKVYERLKTLFGQQILLKWNHSLLRTKMLLIYYVSQMFSLKMFGLNLEKIKKR